MVAAILSVTAVTVACHRSTASSSEGRAAASVGSSAPTASASTAAKGTRITVVPERVGVVRIDRIAREYRVPPTLADGKPAGSGLDLRERLEQRIEVREMAATRVSAVAIEYRRAEVERNGKAIADRRHGQRFELAMRDGMLQVRSGEGALVAEPLAGVVTADHVFLDAAFPLAPFLPDAPLDVGREIEPSHDAVLALVGGAGDFDVKTLELTLLRVEGAGAAAQAVFRVDARFRATIAERPIDLELDGLARTEVATARVRSVEVAGPATTVAREPAEAPARGTAKISVTTDYE
ncbi:MAG: hypothetical protein JW751_28900 [Polyangiaceae bacterium]|nr:hypothetical protein [Polyangiaceae bacterium]